MNILLRITPGVEAHTHEFISTGQIDSKFGFDLGNGSAMRAIEVALDKEQLHILGVHSHIGSQIFEVEGFRAAAQKMATFAADVSEKTGLVFKVINLGGGFGIRYVETDLPLPIRDYVGAITDAIKTQFAQVQMPVPEIWIEPGRSIVGDSGWTLYTIGSRKEIPDVNTYVAVDGGMTDNIRPALYDAKYEAILANRAQDPIEERVTIAGKACESGDKLIEDLPLPKAEAGDILAVSCTGAYNYAMASNYNRIRRPAVVLVHEGEADVLVARETLQDLVRNDHIPERLRLHAVQKKIGVEEK